MTEKTLRYDDTIDYQPTGSEAQLIKEMIADKIREEYHQTPQEFCGDIQNEMTMGGLT